MTVEPLKSLIKDLGIRLDGQASIDMLFGNNDALPIKPSNFFEIKPAYTNRKIVFVDGGNGILSVSPNHIITINRIYFSMFKGKNRIKSKINPRVEFFSYVLVSPSSANRLQYTVKLFPYSNDQRWCLPDEMHLSGDIQNSSVLQSSQLASMSRKFAEWQTAITAVESEMNSGDILVLDGTLQTSFKNEKIYADRLYDAATRKGVIVCGLAKTSLLVTESGHPLLARIKEISTNVPYPMWCVKVTDHISSDNMGSMFAIQLHKNSKYIYRFEMLRTQYSAMTPNDVDMILGSLAANSDDISMLGFPYGAIDADRFAQVRTDELNIYRGMVKLEMNRHSEWRNIMMYDTGLSAHDTLNGVAL